MGLIMPIMMIDMLTITSHRPDIVLIDNKSKTSTIFQLTVPIETNIQSRHTYKQNKYADLERDITSVKISVIAFEIASRVFVTHENQA